MDEIVADLVLTKNEIDNTITVLKNTRAAMTPTTINVTFLI